MWNFTFAFRKRGGTDTFLDLFVARFIWAEKGYLYIYIYQNLSRKVFKNWFLHLLERSWFWRQLFSIQNSIRKTFKNWIFQLLARSLFWWHLISQQHWIKKVFKNWFPHLLARSWFWRQLFSIQHWMKKVFKNWFLRLLFPWRLDRWHKHLKMWNGGTTKKNQNWFFQLLARSWFWWQLFSSQNSI